MTALGDTLGDVPQATAFPYGGAPLDAIIRTDELWRRPSRPPDYAGENKALVALSTALADSPLTILQTLAERVLEVLGADSAGLSLLTKDEQRFYWPAIAGAWQPHIGGGTPRDFGPCGDVLDRNTPILFTHWEQRYPYLREATPYADEGLLVPFYVKGKAVGTIWAIFHTNRRKFDAEDLRLLESLGQFASAAYQAVGSIEDLRVEINARERAEAELRQRYHEIQIEMTHANRVAIIGQLSASIAHEINQPLSAIVTNANTCLLMLASDPPNIDSANATMRRTIRDAKRASDVVKRLYALFAKKDNPNALVDLNDATREVIALSLADLQKGRVILQSDFASDLPSVMGDRVQLQQIILNLVRNAADAMSAIDDRPRQLLISTARSDSDGVRLAVQDSGPGIAPENLERIFEAFYTTKPGGLGMGLSICRTIIEAHGGKLWATPDTPHGALFQLVLPAGGSQ